MAVPKPTGNLDPVALEESLIEAWRAEDTFGQQVTSRSGGKPFIFLEGPPTANGKPGIHHVVARTYKDLVCRFICLSFARNARRQIPSESYAVPFRTQVLTP